MLRSLKRLKAKMSAPMSSLHGKISDEDVVWAYRLLLGREPESPAAIEIHRSMGTRKKLVYNILQGEEFKARARADVNDRSVLEAIEGPLYFMTELPDGLRIWVNLHDKDVSHGVMRGVWEPIETAFVLRHVKEGMHAVDIGANIGWFTTQMARKVGPGGWVTAFEPRADIFRYLAKTIVENRFENVTLHDCALGARNGTAMLEWLKSDESPGSTHMLPAFESSSSDFQTQPTRVRVLDEVVTRKVDFIKIDVEGAEKLVFDGAPRILSADRPLIMSEIGPDFLRRISNIEIGDYFSFIARAGYRVHQIEPDGGFGKEIFSWIYPEKYKIVNLALVPREK